jgi:hypothetical protein
MSGKKVAVLVVLVALAIVSLSAVTVMPAGAQGKSAPKYEYALLKYDGPDRIQIFYPGKYDKFRLGERMPVPKDVRDEEFCVNTMINELAKDGWEPIQLHATRVLFRRGLDR